MNNPSTPQSEYDVRKAKVQQLRDMGIVPYAQGYDKQHSIADLIGANEKNLTEGHVSPFRDINDIIADPHTDRQTAGRLTLYRAHGKLSFWRLMDESGEIQLMFHRDACRLASPQSSTLIEPSAKGDGVSNQKLWIITNETFDVPRNQSLELKQRSSARAVIVNDIGEIWLMHAQKNDYYKLPGGGIDAGESIEEALKREVLEETGYIVRDHQYLWVVEEYREYGSDPLHHVSHGFVVHVHADQQATGLTPDEQDAQFTLVWKPLDEALKLIQENAERMGDKAEDILGIKFMSAREEVFLKVARENIITPASLWLKPMDETMRIISIKKCDKTYLFHGSSKKFDTLDPAFCRITEEFGRPFVLAVDYPSNKFCYTKVPAFEQATQEHGRAFHRIKYGERHFLLGANLEWFLYVLPWDQFYEVVREDRENGKRQRDVEYIAFDPITPIETIEIKTERDCEMIPAYEFLGIEHVGTMTREEFQEICIKQGKQQLLDEVKKYIEKPFEPTTPRKLLDYIQTLPVIFIDAINTSIIKKDPDWLLTPDNLEPNHELRNYLDTLPYAKIIVTNADADVIRTVLKNKTFGNVFTLNNNPNKTDPSYYEKLLEKTFGEGIDKHIYFDHSQANLDSAKQAGMEGILYTGVEELKREIDKKLAYRNLSSPVGEKQDLSWNKEIISLLTGAEASKFLEKLVDIGDFLGVRGELFHTHKGELTLFVSEFSFLAKALRPLGDKFHGIAGQETAYRQRYLDMIHNRETLERMKLRSTFIRTLREFYRSHGFVELETPILWLAASGAAAQPFVTHHHDFDIPMYLRIAPEISLKMATVGGLERVFEIGKDFRNEGSSPAHHQEFTVAEHYAAYRNYEDNMRFTEQMFDYFFDHIPQLSKKVMIADKEWVKREVDFSTPRRRIDYIDQIQQDSWIDVWQYGPTDENALRELIKSKGFDRVGIDTQWTATMIDYLYKKVTRPKIIGPAFIYNYPKTMQPLARSADADHDIAEQFQCIVNGREILKAYSELVDPLEQQSNFDEQAWAAAKGDDEATKGDDEFVKAMEYGMPCQSGRWMGLERIFAMLTQQSNIRDVIMFPMMKPEHNNEWWMTTDNKKEEKKSDTTSTPQSQASNASGSSFSDEIVAQVESVARKYLTETYDHCAQVGRTMRGFAKDLWQDENYWYTVWLLHDVDRDHISKSSQKHLQWEFVEIVNELAIPDGEKAQLIHDIRTHYPDGTGVEPETLVQKYLISIDELSWLIHAYSLMRPEWLDGIKRSSLSKKIKDKKFAAWVDRDHIKNCETYLGIQLEDFAMQVVEKMRE